MIIQCKCKCGTEFEEFDSRGRKRSFVKGHWAKTVAKEIGKKLGEFNKGRIPWNKGLTKETDKRVRETSEKLKGQVISDITKQKISKSTKGEKNHNYGKHLSDDTKRKLSELNQGRKHSKMTIEKIRETSLGRKHSPETKQKISKLLFGHIVSIETRIKISENNKGKHSGENNPMFGKHPSSETKQKMRENHADFKGEKSPNWRGGLSKLPYCPIWTPWLKEEIKERDNQHCQNPDCKSINLLGVHHIDYDKKNCSTDNLITLCRSCNAKANFNREYWQEFYNNILWSKII